MFGDARTGCRHNEHGRGRNIERVGAIATGADDVDQLVGISHVDLCGEFAHHLRCCGDFTDRLFFHTESHGERGDHHRRHFAAHDLAEQR